VKGIITRMDALKHSALIGMETGKPKNMKVRHVMTSPVVTARPVDKVSKIANIMVDKKIMRLPVVDDKNRLLGLIDIEDVLKAYLS